MINFKLKLFSFAFIGPIISLHGQSIGGKVTDKNKVPLEGVVILLKKDSFLIKAELTDRNGLYNILSRGKDQYHLSFSGLNFEEKDTTISLNENMVLDEELEPRIGQLQKVVVTGRRPVIERKIDRFIFNIENNINTTDADGLDLLSKTPMVRVPDGKSVTLVGKSDVRIMVDEKMIYLFGESLTAFLKSIPADNISRIEVITNPSARYDAEGNSGIVNIVTKKTKKIGYFGTANAGYSQATDPTGSGGLSLNYNTNNIRWVGDINFSRGAIEPTTINNYFYSDQTWYQVMKLKEQSRYFRGSIGFETNLSPRTILGVSYNGFGSSPDAKGTFNTTIVNKQQLVDSILNVNYNSNRHFSQKGANLHLIHNLDSTGKKLSVDLDWFNNATSMPVDYENSNYFSDGQLAPASFVKYRSDDEQHSDIYTLNAVIEWPVKKINYSFGTKIIFINNSSTRDLFQDINDQMVRDSANSNQFRFRERTQAAFGNINTSFGKWEFQAGLRAEYTQTTAIAPAIDSTYPHSYINLFPTIYFSRQLGAKNVVSLNFGRRINRPAFRQFNPFRLYQDRYDYSTGNPYIRPSFSNNLELSETFNNVLVIALSYSRSANKAAGIVLLENGSNLHISTVSNYLSSSDYVLATSYSFDKLSWLESQTEVDVYYDHSTSTSPSTPTQLSGFGADITTTNTFHFNKAKKYSAGFDLTYQFPEVSNLVTNRKYCYANLFGRMLLFNKRLQVGLFLRDPFKSKNVSGSTVVNSVGSYYQLNNDSRRGGLTLKYSFGSSKMKMGRLHSGIGSEGGRSN